MIFYQLAVLTGAPSNNHEQASPTTSFCLGSVGFVHGMCHEFMTLWNQTLL